MVSLIMLVMGLILLLTNANGYHLVSDKKSWADAWEYCKNECKSTLATINSPQVSIITRHLIEDRDAENQAVWIGLLGDEWTDSTEYKYTRMKTDTSINDECTAINPMDKYTWVNKPCDNHYKFICNSCDGVLNEEAETNTQWTIVKGNNNALTFDTNDEIGFTINSQQDDTIAIINQKQWKQCDRYKPWVIEMIYSQQAYNSNTGLVFYTSKKSQTDHYFVRVESTETRETENMITDSDLESSSTTIRTADVSLGYVSDNEEEIIASVHILDFPYTDNLQETLRVEIEYGLRFKVSINKQLLIKTGFDKNPFGRTKNEVMSGYVGVESIYSDIIVKQLTVSGMPLFDEEEEWMKTDCIFTYSETDDDMFDDGSISEQNTTTDDNDNGTDDAMNLHPDDDISDILADDDVNGFDTNIILYAALSTMFCCMICVGVYYLKLKQDRKRKLERTFGKNEEREVNIDMEDNVAAEGGGTGRKQPVTLPVDGFSINPFYTIDLNLDGPDPQQIAIDPEVSHGDSNQFQFSSLKIDNFAQYNTYNPYQPKTSMVDNLNSWDIGAIEANCNDILKTSKQGRGYMHSRHSRHSSFG